MSNPFQEQLLKAGVVTKQQVQKARQNNKKPKQQHVKKKPVIDETKLKAQQAAEQKAERDRELNKKRQEQARQKAISVEINQLISNHLIKRGDDCEIVYNFEHANKVKRIYVNDELKQKIIKGSLGIARIEGRYELVPKAIAEKIQQRNEKRVVLFTEEENSIDKDDPYADYQIPDDLTW